MSTKQLVNIEFKKMNLKKYIIQAVIANAAITLLVVITAILNNVAAGEIPQIATSTVIDTLVKSAFIVWQSVLIANLIVEEFRSKTILLLFSYPIDRKKAIISKLIVIFTVILISMVASQLFQNTLFFIINKIVPAISYEITLSDIAMMLLTTVTSIALGMLPLYVGMLNKSTITTVVSSILIVSLTISSGGQDGSGLITVLPVSITMGVIGLGLAYMAIRKILSEDIIL